jgi:hypothetical protein
MLNAQISTVSSACVLAGWRISHNWTKLGLSLMLLSTVSRPVCLGIKHASWAYDQNFITVTVKTVAGLLMWGALSGDRKGLSFTIAAGLASVVILGSESRGTRDHIWLSQIRDFPFRRLLRLEVFDPASIREERSSKLCPAYNPSARTNKKHNSSVVARST